MLASWRDHSFGTYLLATTAVPGLPVVTFVGTVLVLAVASFMRADPRDGFMTWATAVFGAAYVGLLAPFVAMVRGELQR